MIRVSDDRVNDKNVVAWVRIALSLLCAHPYIINEGGRYDPKFRTDIMGIGGRYGLRRRPVRGDDSGAVEHR